MAMGFSGVAPGPLYPTTSAAPMPSTANAPPTRKDENVVKGMGNLNISESATEALPVLSQEGEGETRGQGDGTFGFSQEANEGQFFFGGSHLSLAGTSQISQATMSQASAFGH